MATSVVMPRLGNTVENCIIANWKKTIGDSVTQGEILCEVETDKALVEVESPVSGTLLAIFFNAGDNVPILTNIAMIGTPGELIENLQPDSTVDDKAFSNQVKPVPEESMVNAKKNFPIVASDTRIKISPRARKLARQKNVALNTLQGSGPGGRIIEQDVQAAINAQPTMTPLVKSMVMQGEYNLPAKGSGVSGRIMSGDLKPVNLPSLPVQPQSHVTTSEVKVIPVKGVRKIIAERMLESLQTTAQLTLNASADASALLAYRQKLKNSAESLGLQKVTINDLILLAVSRILLQHPALNALFIEDSVHIYQNIHLGMAVDTARGLMVPVIRRANTLNLKQIAQESKRLSTACVEGKINPDELVGGTFTITNLGSLGIESFTPVLNHPQVAILGVGNINLKPVQIDTQVQFIPHINLSLTVNHQVVDGAPAAHFLQSLTQGLATIEVLLAL